MKTLRHHQLKQKNSFAVSAICPNYYSPTSIEELQLIPFELAQPLYILGEGSNTLFVDDKTPNILHPNIKGIAVKEVKDDIYITVSCSENWHQLVMFCLKKGFHGIENLALIPGSVGAAPVQNIGAYGVELADVIEQVSWYEFSTKQIHIFSKVECQFSYRESIFKNSLNGKGLIIDIVMKLSKTWQPILKYSGLDQLPKNSSAEIVVTKVIELRQQKLPDPKNLPNAGSFFKNPIIDRTQYLDLIANFPDIPAYPQQNEKVKIAAGWLIEQCGLKGLKMGEVGTHNKQALVLVNYNNGLGKAIVQLAQYIRTKVYEKFNILIEPEVRLLTENGLLSSIDMCVTESKD